MKRIRNLMILVLSLFGLLNVNAETLNVPQTITMKEKSSLYYFSGEKKTNYIGDYNFYRKELVDGTLVYCVSNIDTNAPGGLTLYLKGEVQDAGLDYIIRNGYPNQSFTGDGLKDYYITQSAIWEYFDETRGSNNWPYVSFTSSSSGMRGYVYYLVQGARAAKTTEQVGPTISVSGNKTMKLSKDAKYFVSDPMTVKMEGTNGTYNVTLVNAKEGTLVKSESGEEKTSFKDGEKFVIYVPKTTNTSGTVKVSVSSKNTVAKTYEYTSGKWGYQDIGIIYNTDIEASNEITLKYDKVVTKVKISKQDITSKEELPGATLEIHDKNGKLVKSWVSTNEPYYIENLAEGTYTLTETSAPSGYKLSKETVSFTVKSDGSVTSAVMYNEHEVTKVKISKQDITNKEELPGATLEIRDEKGNLIESWVSGSEPHYIEGLSEGNYTLTETIAPNGYVLSSETIKFTLKADGKVETVVMYNTHEVTKVKISKQDITNKEELPGATLEIRDEKGNLIESWVSGSEPHYIEGLSEGNYTLTETIAPNGYVLSSETIKFTLKADGKVETVVMFNEQTKVKISKQDITNKEELPGATLTIKDENGNVVETWVSGSKPHYVEGLKVGTYTLTEEIAPEGYALSSETITFEVKNDGNVTSVIMYNTRYTEVPITDLNMSTTTIVGAVLLMMLGTGLVFYGKHSH